MSKRIFHTQTKLVKALAHPIRLEIIHLLRTHALTVGQIVQMLGLRQAYVSQHLLTLKQAQVVRASRAGKEMYYEVADPKIMTACDNLLSLVTQKSLPEPGDPVVTDPVCGMHLTPKTAIYQGNYSGVRQYYCGLGCYRAFTTKHKGAA